MRTVLTAALVAVCLIEASCSSPGEPAAFDPNGTLSFSYSSVATTGPAGMFTANGPLGFSPTASVQSTTGASAFRQDSLGALVAFHASSATGGDLFLLALGALEQANGTITLDPLSCQQSSLGSCRLGVFIPNIDAAELTGA